MPAVDTTIREFFAAYERRFNQALAQPPDVDVEGTASAFTDCFIAASPLGVRCGANDERFREQLATGFDFYRRIGVTAMTIRSIDVTELDDLHTMARVHWQAGYRTATGDSDAIDFDVIYFLQNLGDGPRVFAFIAGDEQKALRERGLIPKEE